MKDFRFKDLIQDDKFLYIKILLINKNNKKVKVILQGHRNSQGIYFNKNYKKFLFEEKIRINERMRDIMYISQLNGFLMVLENSPALGFLTLESQ